ncbi:hypothetical protein BDD12DRAFT_281271 [Trichophaea hybrida]|nr:hypothetical protein BDD12DRAFT_281271 [Trichophaea hybrida]
MPNNGADVHLDRTYLRLHFLDSFISHRYACRCQIESLGRNEDLLNEDSGLDDVQVGRWIAGVVGILSRTYFRLSALTTWCLAHVLSHKPYTDKHSSPPAQYPTFNPNLFLIQLRRRPTLNCKYSRTTPHKSGVPTADQLVQIAGYIHVDVSHICLLYLVDDTPITA